MNTANRKATRRSKWQKNYTGLYTCNTSLVYRCAQTHNEDLILICYNFWLHKGMLSFLTVTVTVNWNTYYLQCYPVRLLDCILERERESLEQKNYFVLEEDCFKTFFSLFHCTLYTVRTERVCITVVLPLRCIKQTATTTTKNGRWCDAVLISSVMWPAFCFIIHALCNG